MFAIRHCHAGDGNLDAFNLARIYALVLGFEVGSKPRSKAHTKTFSGNDESVTSLGHSPSGARKDVRSAVIVFLERISIEPHLEEGPNVFGSLI